MTCSVLPSFRIHRRPDLLSLKVTKVLVSEEIESMIWSFHRAEDACYFAASSVRYSFELWLLSGIDLLNLLL